jgi:uncharacterized protein YfaS (alpha-2-macroglobulin family)
VILFLLTSCKQTRKEIIPSAAFAPYITAYTGGIISPASTIRIELAQEQPVVTLHQELKQNPFSFSPAIQGKSCWVSNSTLEFTPDAGELKTGTLYNATFRLGDFVQVDKQLQKFDFSFRVEAASEPIAAAAVPDTVIARDDGTFRFLSVRRIDTPENGLELTFSEPLLETQDLKGLVEVPEIPASALQIKDNKVYLFFDANRIDKLTLKVHEGIESQQGDKLGTSHTLSVSAHALKPQVELLTDAAILPDSKQLVIPFRAVNLYAVDLRIIRIYEQNILMFLQSNTLRTSSELRRAGRLVYKKRLLLNRDPSKDIHRWQDYSVDLAGLMRQEPGAVYRIVLSFKQEYSAYPCGGAEQPVPHFADDQLTPLEAVTPSEEESAEWDEPDTGFYYDGGIERNYDLYDWRQRDNPCHPTYYMLSERVASCNVIASNLGVIVKQNGEHKLWITANDLLTAQPVAQAVSTVYNFQLQPIGTAVTDADGFAELTPQGVPFVVVTEAGGQKSYVRVVDGEELSTSRFDVGGKKMQKGLKGYIYGERGVWRPGDTLHVTFVLEDRERRIPDHHPVTLEVYNPQGQFYAKQISTQGTNGFYAFELPTRADDPTGVWNAYVKVGGTAFHKSLRIETIKPNRLKINLKLPRLLRPAAELPVSLSSGWLTGATAAYLKADVELSLTKTHTQFKGYEQYDFNNPASYFAAAKSDLFSGKTDGEGNALIHLKLPDAAAAPGMLNAAFTARVYEPGGDASIYTQTVPFSPFDSYVGIDLHRPEKEAYMETDKDHLFDIVTLTPEGKPVDRTSLEYRIYRIDWSWWWDSSRGGSSLYSAYVNNSSVTPVATGKLKSTGGKAILKFRVDYPDWGAYLVYVKDTGSGHATGGTLYMDWPEWRGRAGRKDPEHVKMLSFSLDKPSYEVGETATAIIPVAAAGSRALLSLESGSTVLRREWLTLPDKGDLRYTFHVTADMAPNIYLHITLLQPHAQTANDLPIRLYGVMPLVVTNRNTVLQPQLVVPEAVRPEEPFRVTVSEQNGKPMTYTLAIVDEGLLDLTGFQTPNPWNEFYAREALGIRTWDMYDDVLGATAGRYGNMFGTGGDEALKPADEKANRFRPVVKFIGPVALAAGKQQTHLLTLPMYVGSVRVMVVAGQDGAYGNAEKSAFVRTPLMMLSTLPRVLGTNEEVLLPVNIFAMEQEVKQVSVAVTSIEGDTELRTVGQVDTQTLTFDAPGDQLAYFRLKTGGKSGKAVIRLTASGGGRQTHETIEIEVRNPNPPVVLRSSEWVEAGKAVTLPYTLSNASLAGSSVTLEVSRIPSVDITRRLDFLYNYHHSCTEQLTSCALPLLFVQQFKEMDDAEQAAAKANVEEAIGRLYGRQLPSGGFVYWQGLGTANDWVTSYTGMFLVLAQEKGYPVQSTVLARWKSFQRHAAQNWRSDSRHVALTDYSQAYRLYTLALAGAPEAGAMNRLKERKTLSLQARWMLAAAYALTGKQEVAAELVFQADTEVPAYTSPGSVYGSSERDEAVILEALLRMNRREEAVRQAQRVSQRLAQEHDFSTQSTAFALMAMGRLAGELSGTLDFGWTWNGVQQPEVKSAKALFTKRFVAASGRGAARQVPASGSITLTNRGSGGLSVDLITRAQVLNDTLPALSHNLKLDVRYTLPDGITPVKPDKVRQGTHFEAHITVANVAPDSDYTDVALTHIVPSGWEIYNERLFGAGDSLALRNYTYRNIRDDRVMTYFDLRRGESKTFTLRLQAAYAGSFVLPALRCEAMYDPTAQARTKAGRTVVE